MIRDKIVFSVQEKTLKEELLREEDLTLAKKRIYVWHLTLLKQK